MKAKIYLAANDRDKFDAMVNTNSEPSQLQVYRNCAS